MDLAHRGKRRQNMKRKSIGAPPTNTAVDYAIQKLTPEMAGMRMSPEEFDAADEWGEDYVYELVEGVLVVVPPVSENERGPNEMLGYLLLSYKEHNPAARRSISPCRRT